MNHRHLLIAAFVLIGLSGVGLGVSKALAEDAPIKIGKADIDTYLKIEYARALNESRKQYIREEKKRDELDKAKEEALKQANWTQEHYDAVSQTISMAVEAINHEKDAGDDGKESRANLEAMDKATVSVIRDRWKELADQSALRDKAQNQAREERDAERRGTPPDPAKLAGAWKFDLDKTVDEIASGLDAETRKKLHDDMAKAGLSSYTFGPGDSIVSEMTDAGGVKRSDKGTYRLEGNTMYFKAEGRKREHKLTLGMKGDNLVISAMGVGMYFTRK